MFRSGLVIILALSATACASTPAARDSDILVPRAETSSWPVENETVPGIFFRLESGPNSPPVTELIEHLSLTVEHNGRMQVINGSAFEAVGDVAGLHQTAYMYLPQSGTMFVTLGLRTSRQSFFPDTERVELNDDCWHMLSYRVRGAVPEDGFHPPPYPRTVFLTPALAPDPPLYLEVSLAGNCFRNPLPPH